ncbi:MAG: response regulator transcription factor [Flavobacteriales bacterium]|nr:response regulator transcription factor [Flavobacteriales bacterium]
MGLKILHANANVLMANGLNAILNKDRGIDKIQNAQDEDSLFSFLNDDDFDLVVIDPLSSERFTIGTTLKLKEKYPQKKVLIISDIHSSQNVLQILEKGVQGYLTRQCDEAEITNAIFAIAKGEKFYCHKVIDIALNKDFDEDNCEPTILTERENEVTTLIASGLTNKEIGEKLHLSHHTIHTHRKNILKKLGIKSVSELTVYAMSVGLI